VGDGEDRELMALADDDCDDEVGEGKGSKREKKGRRPLKRVKRK